MRKAAYCALCFFFLLPTLIQAQTLKPYNRNTTDAEKLTESAKMVNNSTFIFEGLALPFKAVIGEDGKRYVAYRIKILKQYRGNLPAPIVRIVHLPEEFDMYGHGNPNLRFSSGVKQIFFCKLSTQPVTVDNDEGNPVLEIAQPPYSHINFIGGTDGISNALSGLYGMRFESKSAFENYLSTFPNINVNAPEVILQPQGLQENGGGGSSGNINMRIDNNFFDTKGKRAGVGDTIIIRGANFGTTKGKVYFSDANKEAEAMTELNAYYIKSWTNTAITVEIPTFITDDAGVGQEQLAGSGPITVVHNDAAVQPVTSISSLNIEYALLNTGEISNATNELVKVNRPYLANNHCVNGFIFSLHKDFKNTQNRDSMILAIDAALKRWESNIGITLKLERDANNQPIYRNDYVGDATFKEPYVSPYGVNLIYLTGPKSGQFNNKQMATSKRFLEGNSNTKELFRESGSIFIDTTFAYRFSYDVPLEINYHDFFGLFAHEIGHFLLLNHDTDLSKKGMSNRFVDQNLMNYGFSPSEYFTRPANERCNITLNSDRALNGARRIKEDSKTKTWTLEGLKSLTSANPFILPTPIPSTSPNYKNKTEVYCSNKTDSRYNNYWSPSKSTAQCISASRSDYSYCTTTTTLRLKDAGCTFASAPVLASKYFTADCYQPLASSSGSNCCKKQARIAPNPALDVVSIIFTALDENGNSIPVPSDQTHDETIVYIYDQFNNLVFWKDLETLEYPLSVDINQWKAGLYHVILVGENNEVIDIQTLQKLGF